MQLWINIGDLWQAISQKLIPKKVNFKINKSCFTKELIKYPNYTAKEKRENRYLKIIFRRCVSLYGNKDSFDTVFMIGEQNY